MSQMEPKEAVMHYEKRAHELAAEIFRNVTEGGLVPETLREKLLQLTEAARMAGIAEATSRVTGLFGFELASMRKKT